MTDDRSTGRFAVAPEAGEQSGKRVGGRGPFPRRLLRGPDVVEAYLRADSLPRYIQRLREIETEFQAQRRRLEAAYRSLEEAWGHDAETFARRWRLRARAWRFERLNQLIREHNEWYPVEASLPMDPRTRDYVPVNGRSYRRIELGPEWVLGHLPPAPRGEGEAPRLPSRPPQEPRARAPRGPRSRASGGPRSRASR